MSNISGLIKTIRSAQQQVAKKILKIQGQLKKVEALPSTQPWVSYNRVSTVAELRGTNSSLKQALNNDLILLKQQMRQMKRQVRVLKTRAIRQQADQAKSDFKKQLEDVLKKAERSGGELGEGELELLSQQSEKVLENYVKILETNPSPGNLKAVLDNMEIPMLLGSDESSGVCDKAMGALGNAADKLQTKADQNFRNNPTVDKLDGLLQSQILVHQLGGSGIKNPVGWSSVNKVHKVLQGDTLSGISQTYYGKPSFWDVIYLENAGGIGEDPASLIVGAELVIP